MLHCFKMEDCKSIISPMDFFVVLTEYEEKKSEEKRFPYREAIDCLNYIATVSRSNISYVMSTLARYSNNP